MLENRQADQDVFTKNDPIHFITFSCNQMMFAINALCIKEFKPYKDITIQTIGSSIDTLGVAYLYNKIIPIFNLMSILSDNLEHGLYFDVDSIIFIELNDEIAGLSIGGIPHFVGVSVNDIQKNNPTKLPFSRYLKGMIRRSETECMILDIDKLLFDPSPPEPKNHRESKPND
jgi:chemotaxis signal transduction protein